MKIGLIGNMNNNNFALMRYFRDLGADAHLLQWSDDGIGSLGHFMPEGDSWEIQRWADFIHRLEFPQSYLSVVGRPSRLRPPPSRRRIRDALAPYDTLIGSGLSPVIVSRAGRHLDIFFPYSTGIEYVDELSVWEKIRRGPWGWRLLAKYLRRRQIEGIRGTRRLLNAEMGPTAEAFRALGLSALPLATPMLYNREVVSEDRVPEKLKNIRDEMTRFDFICFSHASHRWFWEGKADADSAEQQNKHNDWLIRGFSEFLATSGRHAVLVLLEYGPDVGRSRKLIDELGIDGNVLWLPQMPRKHIMYLLKHCHVGVGEFTVWPGCIWGGTGWEVLASGKPLLQSFNFSGDIFHQTFGHPSPPVLDAKSSRDIATHLLDMASHPDKAAGIGAASSEWFNTHNGIGLAKRWLDLLRTN